MDTFLGWPFLILQWSVCTLWLMIAVKGCFDVQSLRRLAADDASDEALPSVSVIVPARDEEARIETSLRRLLAQNGVKLQVVAVDDRSRDQTGAIMQKLAGEDARIKPVRIDALPERWLGKCYACHTGAKQATGEWLLFSDGDVWLQPDVIRRAVRAGVRESADHVCLTFGSRHGTLAGKACQLFMVLSVAGKTAGIDRGRPGAYIGLGAFNLISRKAFDAIGGYEPLRLTIVDDVKLGLLVRRAGLRTRAFLGGDDVDADWAASLASMLRVMRKNHFALVGYSVPKALAGAGVLTLTWLVAALGPFTGTWAGWAAGLAWLALSVPAGIVARRSGAPLTAAFLAPVLFPVMALSLLNSAFTTVRQGGIRWRDTFYPLAMLRDGDFR